MIGCWGSASSGREVGAPPAPRQEAEVEAEAGGQGEGRAAVASSGLGKTHCSTGEGGGGKYRCRFLRRREALLLHGRGWWARGQAGEGSRRHSVGGSGGRSECGGEEATTLEAGGGGGCSGGIVYVAGPEGGRGHVNTDPLSVSGPVLLA